MSRNIRIIRFLQIFAAIVLTVALSGPAWADKASLVSVDWLSKHSTDRNLIVLDVRTFSKYEKRHIPGAVQAFGPWQKNNDEFVGFMMPKVNELVHMLRQYGVSNDSYVVLYDAGLTAQDTAKSARALWTLRILGHSKVAILDGGFAAWEQAEKPVTAKATVLPPGDFTAALGRSGLISLDEVRSKLGSKKTVFVDTRLPVEHFGHEKKNHVKRYGHLPGSRLVPASYLTVGGLELSPSFIRSVSELKQIAVGAGIPRDKNVEIVTYSNHGLQAALGYFVLHDMLGYRNVRLFDGSILEAAADSSIPMERYSWGFKKK